MGNISNWVWRFEFLILLYCEFVSFSRSGLRKERTTLSRTAGSERGVHTRASGIQTNRSRRAGTANNNDSGDSSDEDDDEEEEQLVERARQDQTDLPAEYWQIQRLVKYLKVKDLEFLAL